MTPPGEPAPAAPIPLEPPGHGAAPAWLRPGPPAARPQRWLLHAALFAVTFLSLAYAGGLFWEGGLWALDSLAAALEPPVVLACIARGLEYALWVVAILLAHDMGHYLACRCYSVPCTLPFFIPGPPFIGSFGAVIRIRGAIPDRRALFDIAAAGPLAGYAVTLVALAIGIARAEVLPSLVGGEALFLGEPLAVDVLARLLRPDVDPERLQVNAPFGAAWVGMLVTSLNLFPAGQLDGGHAAYALSRRLHRFVSWTSIALLFGLIAVQALGGDDFPPYVVWFAVVLWMRDRHPRLRSEVAPVGGGRWAVALVLLLVFTISFMPVPIWLGEIPADAGLDDVERTVAVRAQDPRTRALEALDDGGVRVPERVAPPGADERQARPDPRDERLARAARAAVVRNDEQLGGERTALLEQLVLARALEIAGDERAQRPHAGEQHDRAVVRRVVADARRREHAQ